MEVIIIICAVANIVTLLSVVILAIRIYKKNKVDMSGINNKFNGIMESVDEAKDTMIDLGTDVQEIKDDITNIYDKVK